MDKLKQEIAWLIAGQMDRKQSYTALEIEQLVRTSIRPNFLTEPSRAPDHIRVAMVEAGYITRDDAGATYRVSDCFAGPKELEERERALLRSANEISVQYGVVACPECGHEMQAPTLFGHCQRWHCWSKLWSLRVEKYGR
jgi:hypothetical protein